MSTRPLEVRRRAIRRRALTNLTLALRSEAQRTEGRLVVSPFVAGDGVLRLDYADVRTLVHGERGFALARRDFSVLLVCPDLWPFEREAGIRLCVLTPGDWAHPNSDGHFVCISTEGVLPERIPGLIFDNVRLRQFRLDHAVDEKAAGYVRGHLAEFPADRRPLYPPPAEERRAETKPAGVPAPQVRDAPPSRDDEGLADILAGLACPWPPVDVTIGVLGVAVPALEAPAFIRLAPSVDPTVDRARAMYLRAAAARRLRSGRVGWVDGPGIATDPATAAPEVLRAELTEVGRGIALLDDERVARSYIDMHSVNAAHGDVKPHERQKGGLVK
jgi:hypothetical protein